MNLTFLIQKKHIFKRRISKSTQFSKIYKHRAGIYTINQIRFEFVYLRTFRKIFRKKYLKKKAHFKKFKFWIMIKPNFLLTMKSKNSRMGSGVGSYVRVASLVKPNKPIILFKKYSHQFLRNTLTYLKLKLNLNLCINIKKKKKV